MSFVSLIIGIMVALIVLVAVVMPVVSDVITNISGQLSGTTVTVLSLVPLLLAVGAIILVTKLYG